MVKIIGILLAVVKSLYKTHLSLRDHSELCFGWSLILRYAYMSADNDNFAFILSQVIHCRIPRLRDIFFYNCCVVDVPVALMLFTE